MTIDELSFPDFVQMTMMMMMMMSSKMITGLAMVAFEKVAFPDFSL